MVEQARRDIVPPAELSRAAFTAQEVLDDLHLELSTEMSLVPHGKVLSAPIIGHLTMPNLPNPMCPVLGVHSKMHLLSSQLVLQVFGLDNQFAHSQIGSKYPLPTNL